MKPNFAAIRKARGPSEPRETTEASETSGTGGITETSGLTELTDTRGLAGLTDAALEQLDIDPAVYDQLLNGSKNAANYPWIGLDVNGSREPKKGGHQRPLRFNAYEKALIHYVAGIRQMTVNKLILTLVKKAALAEVRRREK